MNAFLYGDLQEVVYMEQPSGYVAQGESQMCKLRKTIYGLKPSSRVWFDKFSKVVSLVGFTRSSADHSLFVRKTTKGLVVLAVYVDDILLIVLSQRKYALDLLKETGLPLTKPVRCPMAVGKVSQFMQAPKECHLRSALKIQEYAKGSPGKGLLFRKHNIIKVEAYSNASYADNKEDKNSTSDFSPLTFFSFVIKTSMALFGAKHAKEE
ncbi:hypothetical protein KSP39_PZI017612 [Platanthera zijinensis]|uniref:Reverse transcriptase Ty1/copia-type domain-containing protein n=1 Tax=Platanthera zijinensis TaxID=2320716 RepID=A0AAP0G0G8_9ASPA